MGRGADVAASPTPKAASWLRWGGPLVLTVSLILHVISYSIWPIFALQIDTLVYRFGGLRVFDGLDLYSIGRNGGTVDLLFTYTPFAAVFFVPLAWLTDHGAQIFALIAFPLLVVYVTVRILRYLGLTARTGLWGLAALLVGLELWLQPIRLSIQLGQINILILAAVVFDMLAPKHRKWAGVAIGVVAGIKLTPAVFIVYLLLIGRVRAAIVAVSTFVATVLIGFAVLPSESTRYWIGGAFVNTKRIASDPSIGTSVQSLFERLQYPSWLATFLSAALLVAGFAVATYAYRKGQLVLGVAIVGMASAAASPFSWSHHWVWFVPLVIHFGYRAYVAGSRRSAYVVWAMSLLFADWPVSMTGQPPPAGLLKVRLGDVWNTLIPSAYVFVLVAVLVGTVLWLRRQRTESAPVEEPAPEPMAIPR